MNLTIEDFTGKEKIIETDTLYTAKIDNHKFTVLDRETGFGNGIRDIETGYKNSNFPKESNFWLASCGCDIREHLPMELDDAIKWVKDRANNVVGKD